MCDDPRPQPVSGSTLTNHPCPWLPETAAPLDHMATRRHGKVRDTAFYQDALAYAQSLWQSGKPAQALLQLNKAWMADPAPPADLLETMPPPYRALVWLLRHAEQGNRGFLGNPVRHFQHLATRMSGPNPELRIWRAWACFHLASRALRPSAFPPDGVQIARTGLWVPGWRLALNHLTRHGWPGEADEASRAMADATGSIF